MAVYNTQPNQVLPAAHLTIASSHSQHKNVYNTQPNQVLPAAHFTIASSHPQHKKAQFMIFSLSSLQNQTNIFHILLISQEFYYELLFWNTTTRAKEVGKFGLTEEYERLENRVNDLEQNPQEALKISQWYTSWDSDNPYGHPPIVEVVNNIGIDRSKYLAPLLVYAALEKSTTKILCDLNEKFRQYHPPATKILYGVNSKFNVFFSFCKKDVRKTFVDYLYESLSGVGIRVFLDRD
ncbi:uncharacterized protein LOC131029220 isoform X2 [Cryptomeria japonica]|nr:uncharacterized protein LOC131029220 isoform X2 [Cryptomeria japonica]